MRQHLRSCLEREDGGAGRPSRLLWLRIQDAHGPLYWLDVEVKAAASLSDLDQFLRDFWLECCGHSSAFDIDRVRYESNTGFDEEIDFGGPLGSTAHRTMSDRIGDALDIGASGRYEYDFGSTTELKFKVLAERKGRIGSDPLRLLAFNEAPEWKCGVCGEAAALVDSAMPYGFGEAFYCDEHASEAEDEFALLPVVNSPRIGVCGYSG
jgi:hypothetical protein